LQAATNSLVDDIHKFKIVEISSPEKNAIDALWVIEACYDEDGEVKTTQGTGFQLKDKKIITCAHVILENGNLYKNIEAYKASEPTKMYKIKVEKFCVRKDVAICSIQDNEDKLLPNSYIEISEKILSIQDNVKLLGFPAYALGHTHYIADSKVARLYIKSLVDRFEIDHSIREGNSGGPIINSDSEIVGIALEGARKEGGHNGCLLISELKEVLESDEYLAPS